MGLSFIADTNVVIDFLNGQLPEMGASWLQQATDKQLIALPVIVRIELLSWNGGATEMQLLADYITQVAE